MEQKKALNELWSLGYFSLYKQNKDIESTLLKEFGITSSNITMILKNCKFLRKTKSGWIQKGNHISKPKKINDLIIPNEIVLKEKGYFQKVISQINGCYQDSYYDACFVMVRRAIETLIIEAYESKGIENEIRDNEGNFFQFGKLIDETIANSKIKLSKIAKTDLKIIKKFGDTAAHNRRLNLIKSDIDKYSDSIRLIVEELINNK